MDKRVMDVSLFDQPDSKDSGFVEDALEDCEKLLESSLGDETTMCFTPNSEATPKQKPHAGNKKRLFSSPVEESPSLVVANSLKRLGISELGNTPKASGATSADEASDSDEPIVKIRKVEEWSDVQRGVIREAVEKSSEGNLVGNFSKDYALPLINVTHSELKIISADTMKDVLDGKYMDAIQSFKIIDSRYPYEYEGGHIRGAVNIYTSDSCLGLLDDPANPKNERHVLIFHCEFSKQRGPSMNRNLRKEDRTRNAMNYPQLKHPEMYVLEGGYKKFFENHPGYCDPKTYVPMLHPENWDDLKFFRKKSKTESAIGTSKKCPKVVRISRVVRKTLSDVFV